MMGSALPSFHVTANEQAVARVDGARAVRDRATDLLDEIDALIGCVAPVAPVRR
jgi:hypothetical protein